MAEKRERLVSKDYLLVIFSAMGTCFVNYFFFSTLTPYVTMLTGSSLQAGLMTTVYSLAALAARPVTGVLADNSGRVKLLIIGAVLCALTCAGFSIFSVFWMLLIIRGLNGVGFGMHSTCAGAVVADVVPKSRLTEGIGYFGLYSTVGQMIAPSIALAIVKGGTIGEYRVLFILSMVLCLFSAACSCGLTYERKRRKNAQMPGREAADNGSEPEEAVSAPPVKTLLGFEYAVFAPGAVLVLLFLGQSSIMSYITVFAQWRGFDNAGLYFAFSAVGTLLSRLIFGRIADNRGADIVVIPGIIVFAVCLAVMPSVGSMLQLALLALPCGIAQGMALPTLNSMLFRRCSPLHRGTASGAYYAAIDIGFAIGAPILGAVADAFDYRYIYRVSAVLVVLALVLYILIASDKRFEARTPV